MIAAKGIADAVAAVRRARELGAPVELDLYGAPDPSNRRSCTEAELREMVGRAGHPLARTSADVAEVWRTHHIAMLLTWYREGVPRSLIEAAACGRPIVTTIAAPTHLHHEIALACIARGIHVLVEKPIASTVEEGARHRRRGAPRRRDADGRPCRALQSGRRRDQGGDPGEDILSIAITRVGPFPPRMSNVGVVIDLAVHDIDLIRWFTDSDIVEVQPQLSSAVAEREDIALLQFRTASGVLAHINTNWLTPFKARNVTVATRGKYVMGDLLTRQVTECFGFKPDGSYSMRHLPVGHDEPLRAELIAFLDAVRTGGEPARGDRRRGRRQPRNRDPLPGNSRQARGLRRAQGAAPRRRLTRVAF
jgi:hypothetical protein